MRVTTVEGTVENGQVRLPADIRLPENAKVYVVVPGVEERATNGPKLEWSEERQ